MIKLILCVLFVAIIGFFVACSDYEKTQDGGMIYGNTVRVFVIDGCEYIIYDRGITHKGNCTNSIHKFKN